MTRTLVVLGLICSVAAACAACKAGGDGSTAAAEPEMKPAPAEPKAVPAATPAPPTETAVSDRVEDPSFELALLPAGRYAVGQLGSLAVSLKPRGEYHINQDFPITVALKAPATLRMPKLEYKKPDAAVFGEKLARFDVPLTPEQAGTQRIEANVRFAVCTPENCVPDERTLALMLPVE